MKDFFSILSDIIGYIVDLRIFDIPLILAYTGVTAVFSYCTAMIIIGFPCAIYKDVFKKEINDEKEDAVTKYVAICLFVILSIILLCELATES